jgi:hypothetical protein
MSAWYPLDFPPNIYMLCLTTTALWKLRLQGDEPVHSSTVHSFFATHYNHINISKLHCLATARLKAVAARYARREMFCEKPVKTVPIEYIFTELEN